MTFKKVFGCGILERSFGSVLTGEVLIQVAHCLHHDLAFKDWVDLEPIGYESLDGAISADFHGRSYDQPILAHYFQLQYDWYGLVQPFNTTILVASIFPPKVSVFDSSRQQQTDFRDDVHTHFWLESYYHDTSTCPT